MFVCILSRHNITQYKKSIVLPEIEHQPYHSHLSSYFSQILVQHGLRLFHRGK